MIDPRRLIVVLGLAGTSAALAADTAPDGGGPARPPDEIALVYDNGDPNGVNGYMSVPVGGFGRSLLDDFVVSAAPIFLSGLRHHAVWQSLPPGSGETMEIVLRADANGTPGPIVQTLDILTYAETPTGNVYFGREEYTAFTTFETIWLDPGRYWFEATVAGPEQSFWLTADQRHEECWVDYEGVGGLMPGSEWFDVASDLAWELWGDLCTKEVFCCTPDGECKPELACADCAASGGRPVLDCLECAECPADLDANGTVTFNDLVLLLGTWGNCEGVCPGDLNRDATVDFADLLILLSVWGPCAG